MPIANKEFILNYTTSRWGLNKKVNVGSTSDSIRLCSLTVCKNGKITITPMLEQGSKL